MKSIFDPSRLWPLTWGLAVLALVKIVWVGFAWLAPLPVTGVDRTRTTLRHALHYRYHLADETQPDTTKKVVKVRTKRAPRNPLKAYKLVGIYSTATKAVVTLMRGTKSYVVSNEPKGGRVEGYRLQEANATSALFEKNGDRIRLKLFETPSKGSSSAIRRVSKPPASSPSRKPKPKPDTSAPIVQQGETRLIDRGLIREYSQHPDKIWKNIGLYEVKNGNKLDGFKVRFVRRGSPFEKLGLQRGDVIKAINGEPIVDYATPMRMLRNADSLEDLSLTIERNHEEQELRYEVK